MTGRTFYLMLKALWWTTALSAPHPSVCVVFFCVLLLWSDESLCCQNKSLHHTLVCSFLSN